MTDQSGSFGQELRRRREDARLSLSTLAARVHYSTGYLSKIENGRKPPTADLARLCDAELGAGGRLAALVATGPVPGAVHHDVTSDAADADEDDTWTISLASDGSGGVVPLDRRKLLKTGAGALIGLGFSGHGVAAAARDGSALLAFRAQFDQLRRFGQTTSPSVVLPTLIVQTRTVGAIADRADPALRSELLGLAARYSEFAGWMAQEAGNDRAAGWLTSWAVDLAVAGGDRHFERYALVRKADLAMYRYDATSTIGLAGEAQRDETAPARVRAIATMREAQGHALAGDYDTCLRVLDRATRLFELAAVEDSPGPVLGSPNMNDPIATARAWCLYEVGRPAEAAAGLDLVVKGLAPDARRARALWGARLVLAHAVAGEIDHACASAGAVLDDAEIVDSATARHDLRALSRTLTRWRNHPPVRELMPRLTRVLHTPGG